MSHRFFAPEMQASQELELFGSEAHHLLHVMRAKTGDEISLFDGQGHEAPARVMHCTRQTVRVEVGAISRVSHERNIRLVLAVALPKGDRQKWLVEKLTELGVARLVPLVTAHSEAQPGAKAIERLTRNVVEASKQCGRNQLMEIAKPVDYLEWLRSIPTETMRLVAHPGGESLSREHFSASQNEVVIAIGPEGGFSNEEIAAALAANWTTVSLAPAILRIETAAVAAAAIAGHLADDQASR